MDRCTGVPLIELLVVIPIVSLLISILLPALSSARRSGQRVACLASERAISQGAASYATDSEDAIIGSPSTSGAYLTGRNGPAYGPAVQRWDFMGPLASLMGVSIAASDGNGAALANRLNDLRSRPAFMCRGNSFLGLFRGDAGATGPVEWSVIQHRDMKCSSVSPRMAEAQRPGSPKTEAAGFPGIPGATRKTFPTIGDQWWVAWVCLLIKSFAATVECTVPPTARTALHFRTTTSDARGHGAGHSPPQVRIARRYVHGIVRVRR